MTTGPIWITPNGHLLTATELVATSTNVIASGTNVTYKLISGQLPTGLTVTSTGTISGVPTAVIKLSSYNFVIRASSLIGVSDRQFTISITGAQAPTWSTSSGFTSLIDYNTSTAYLKLGPRGENFTLNKQYVDFQFLATPTNAPSDTKLDFYIPENGGELPPNLILDRNGRLSGFMNDVLVFDNTEPDTGGYDEEGYDNFTYDFGNIPFDSIGVPKIYQFKVRASDGVLASDRLFKILVVSPEMIRQPNLIQMTLETGLISSNTNYIPPPQFVKGNDLGIARAENNEMFDVSAYDGYPLIGSIVQYFTTSTTIIDNFGLPPNLNLDPQKGVIYGYIPYQPAYTKKYNITVNAIKYDGLAVVTSTNTFTLAIQGETDSSIEWVTSSTLGSINTGYLSELAVQARQINSDYTIKYEKISGDLPPGITLERDGSLSGRVDYGSTGTYTFEIQAKDVYELSAIEREFTLNVTEYDANTYTRIWVKPFLTLEKRNTFREFMTDTFTFPQASMYRYFDPNFGVQTEIKMILEFGIQQQNLVDYLPALRENFYRKRFYFGDVKVALAKDSNNNDLYELVYVDVVDDQIQTTGTNIGSTSKVIYMNNEIYYPNSIDNMRDQLEHLTLNATTLIKTDEQLMPVFMRTAQEGDYKPPGYVHVIPLCYVLPGEGKKILSRIKLSGFNFQQFDMDIDRLIIDKTLDNSTAKYLLFPRKNITDAIPEDGILYVFDETPLETENNQAITRE